MARGSPGGLRNRLRYRFDNLLSRGTWAAVVWLGAITLVAVLGAALLLNLFGVTFAGSESSGFFEDLWQSLLRTLDTGTMAGDVGWGRRMLALIITIVGILVAGTLIGLIASGVEQRVDGLRRGRSLVTESGHVVVLGGTSRLPVLVEQLALAGRGRRDNTVVVLADDDPADLGDRLRGSVDDLAGTRLVLRSGSPTRLADLALVALDDARSVIVLHDDGPSDAGVVKTVLAAGSYLGSFDRIPIVAELHDAETAHALVALTDGAVHVLVATRAIARIAAFALREPGLNRVIEELTDFHGCDLYLGSPDELAGRTFAEAVRWFADARVLGRLTPAGEVELNPRPDVELSATDRLILLANDDRKPRRRSAAGPAPARQPPAPPLWRAKTEQHLLVVGWNRFGALLLDELDATTTDTSSARVVYDPRLISQDELPAPSTAGFRVSTIPASTLVWDSADATVPSQQTAVLLLGYRGAVPPDDADSRTLLNLLSLRRELEAAALPRPRLVAELVVGENADLAQLGAADEIIVSDAISSRLLAQLAEEPARRPILLSLYGPEGPSVHLVDAPALGATGRMTFGELVDTAYAHGVLAIGWRRAGAVELNPDDRAEAALADEDQVVVIG